MRVFRRHIRKGLHVLDVGCSPGRWLLFFDKTLGCSATGIDVSEKGVSVTRAFLAGKGSGASVLFGDLTSPEWLDSLRGKFDRVTSLGVIEHFEGDSLAAMVEAHMNALRDGGMAIITIPNYGPESLLYRQEAGNISGLERTTNLAVMDAGAFKSLFSRWRVIEMGYAGPALLDRHFKNRGLSRVQAVVNIALGWPSMLLPPGPAVSSFLYAVVEK